MPPRCCGIGPFGGVSDAAFHRALTQIENRIRRGGKRAHDDFSVFFAHIGLFDTLQEPLGNQQSVFLDRGFHDELMYSYIYIMAWDNY